MLRVKKYEGKEAKPEEVQSGIKEEETAEDEEDMKVSRGTKRMAKPKPKPKPKAKSKARELTPSDDSSDDDFAPEPGSPTAGKRPRRELNSKTDGPSDTPSPFLKATGVKDSGGTDKAPGEMTLDELLAHHGVNTAREPYKAHLLSRHEPVVSDPVIAIPELVKRGFKPRPSAREIQQSIQDKVREKMGLGKSTEKDGSDE